MSPWPLLAPLSFLKLALEAPEADPSALHHHGYTLALSHTVQPGVHGALSLTYAVSDVPLGAGLRVRR